MALGLPMPCTMVEGMPRPYACTEEKPGRPANKGVIAVALSALKLYTLPKFTVKAAAGAKPVYVAIAISGFTALSAQVLWTRLLSLSFGATTYTFSLILGGFLLGLGIGSSVGANIARTTTNPRAALGWCQIRPMEA